MALIDSLARCRDLSSSEEVQTSSRPSRAQWSSGAGSGRVPGWEPMVLVVLVGPEPRAAKCLGRRACSSPQARQVVSVGTLYFVGAAGELTQLLANRLIHYRDGPCTPFGACRGQARQSFERNWPGRKPSSVALASGHREHLVDILAGRQGRFESDRSEMALVGRVAWVGHGTPVSVSEMSGGVGEELELISMQPPQPPLGVVHAGCAAGKGQDLLEGPSQGLGSVSWRLAVMSSSLRWGSGGTMVRPIAPWVGETWVGNGGDIGPACVGRFALAGCHVGG